MQNRVPQARAASLGLLAVIDAADVTMTLSMEICGIPHLTQRTRQIWGTHDLWNGKISKAKFQLVNVGRRTLPNPEQRMRGDET